MSEILVSRLNSPGERRLREPAEVPGLNALLYGDGESHEMFLTESSSGDSHFDHRTFPLPDPAVLAVKGKERSDAKTRIQQEERQVERPGACVPDS
jgi:hypothetical protein